jgi:hypothetical protein
VSREGDAVRDPSILIHAARDLVGSDASSTPLRWRSSESSREEAESNHSFGRDVSNDAHREHGWILGVHSVTWSVTEKAER